MISSFSPFQNPCALVPPDGAARAGARRGASSLSAPGTGTSFFMQCGRVGVMRHATAFLTPGFTP